MSKVRTRIVGVKGGNHPDGMKWKVNVTVDYTETDIEQILNSAFAHDVVRLQNSTLRPASKEQLDKWEQEGFSTTGAQVASAQKGADPVKVLMAMGLDEPTARMVVSTPGLLADAMSKIPR